MKRIIAIFIIFILGSVPAWGTQFNLHDLETPTGADKLLFADETDEELYNMLISSLPAVLDLEIGIDIYSIIAADAAFQSADDDLTDLADGSLTGTKVGFSDSDSNFNSDNIDAAMSELDNVINGGVPNSATAKVNWSQLVDVPAGFADGSDATGTGGDQLVDIVTTTPLLIDDGANKDNVLPGTDADITFSMPAATNAIDGHMTSASMVILENNAKNKYSLTIDGGGSAITTGVKYNSFFFIPRNLTLTGVALTTNEQVGSCTVDVWAGMLGGTTGFLNITNSNSLFNVATPPSITDASVDNTIGVSSFDVGEADFNNLTVIGVNIDACTTLTRICIVFYFE